MPPELLSGYRVGSPVGGPECEAFERELEAYYNVPYARVFNSCTSALHAACVAVDIGSVHPDPCVPAYSMSASVAAAVHAGATKLRFYDLREDGYKWISVGPNSPLVGAPMILVNLFGHHFPVLTTFTANPVIHDCAQSPSLKPNGRPDDVWCYSLNQHKIVSCGEGGYALTYSREVADRLHAVRNHGECYTDDVLGWNYRMTEPVAAIARREFRHLDRRLDVRRQWAESIRKKYDLPADDGNVDWFVYPVRCAPDRRNEAVARIPGSRAGYHTPIYRLPYFAKRYPGAHCPNAEALEASLMIINPMEYGL